MKTITAVGCFGFGKELFNGQTIKTKIVVGELNNIFGEHNVVKIDTYGGVKIIFKLFVALFKAFANSQNIIIFPAHNGLRIIAPLCVLYNKIFHRVLHYVVIGGWLPEFTANRKFLTRVLKGFDYIYVETKIMESNLVKQGFTNICLMPNCKELRVLKEDELVYSNTEPYKLCTFSRITKTKGIEEAVIAVYKVNKKLGKTAYTLDIYGQIDEGQLEWFNSLKLNMNDCVCYAGVVPFDRSVDVLKKYFLLLFPTYYEGEGFAGTLIDAFAAGVPVIASDWKANTEIVRENYTGFICKAKDADSLAEKLLMCYNNVVICNTMKAMCIKVALDYLPKSVIQVLIDRIV